MRVKGILVEDFVNYRKPSMFISTAICDWKCCKEQGILTDICQNAPLAALQTLTVDDEIIYAFYARNDITKAVVVGGLEPFLQFEELEALIKAFRDHGEMCDFVIYTGYEYAEIGDEVHALEKYGHIIIKFGRFKLNSTPIFDDVLGIELASNNQHAMRIC